MKKILIIEDDASFAELLKAKLTEKYKVELCQDGQSGYYAIYEYKPDVVLLSMMIAQMDAVSLVGKMRVQKQFQKLPIFVVADTKALARADDALAAGANEAFLKDESGAVNSILAALNALMTPSLARKPSAQPDLAGMVVHATLPPATLQTAPLAAAPAAIATKVLTRPASAAPATIETVSQIEAAFNRATPHFSQSESETNPTGCKLSQFLDIYGESAHSIRQDFIRYRTATEKERPEHLKSLLTRMGALNAEANGSGFPGLARYLTVIESRVRQLLESNTAASPSSLQGLATAVDALAALNNHVEELEPLNNLNPLALIVDDDAVSRKTLSLGLEKSKIKTTAVDNPDAALLEAESKPFDLIFLDVDLPKMSGFALCARIRIIPSHRKTPILFVTSLNDIKSRASSRVSGGNDFITKPINLYKLGINSWSLIINRRVLQNGRVAEA